MHFPSNEGTGTQAATVAGAGGLGLKIVAEGVETEEQLATLGNLGCKVVQSMLLALLRAPPQFQKRR